MQIPRGERYEMCRSVHAEANAIIAAPRDRMLGATLYMTCVNPKDGSLYDGTNSCMMCKRQIINAGIETVIVRDTKAGNGRIGLPRSRAGKSSIPPRIKKICPGLNRSLLLKRCPGSPAAMQ